MPGQSVGGCLCGEVRFEVEGDFEGFFLCHCERCRKGTGSAHAANLFSSKAKLTWLAGEDKARLYKLPGTRHCKCFCTHCGSALPYQRASSGGLVVPAGSLTSEVTIKPTAHIFVASKAGWEESLAQAPRFDTFQG